MLDPAQDPRAFRDALGQFATGVTLVTAQGAAGPVGITANSFASLSLEPPLVLWSVALSSSRAQTFIEADHFAIHVLSADQERIARAFAARADAFADVPPRESPRSVPLIDGCLAHFECEREAVHPGGDHALIIGRVVEMAVKPGTPLIFAGGTFGTPAR